jgi:undecaprenyl diphosphate synthase
LPGLRGINGIMVELTKSILSGLSGLSLLRSKKPLHVAVNTCSLKEWADDSKKEFSEAVKKHIEKLDELIDLQLKNDIKILTINLNDYEPEAIIALREFFEKLLNDERINNNQIRVFVIGQWYGIDNELSERFKELMEKTKDYDKSFLNFCIKYDGQEEILGAVRLMVRKILSEKMKEEDLTTAMIKENLYSSYFPPPQLIIEPSGAYSGLLLWDAKGAIIYNTDDCWLSLDKKEFDKAISFYAKNVREENK